MYYISPMYVYVNHINKVIFHNKNLSLTLLFSVQVTKNNILKGRTVKVLGNELFKSDINNLKFTFYNTVL